MATFGALTDARLYNSTRLIIIDIFSQSQPPQREKSTCGGQGIPNITSVRLLVVGVGPTHHTRARAKGGRGLEKLLSQCPSGLEH